MARKKRRGHGEGALFQRSDGRWVARITVGFDANGRQKTRTRYGRTKAEAAAKLREMTNAKADGTLTPPNQQTVADFLTDWLQTTAKRTVTLSSWVRYESLVRLHIVPRIGRIRLTALTPATVRRMYSDMAEDGKTDCTMQAAHVVLRRALQTAVREGTLPRNVCDAVDRPSYQSPAVAPLDREQISALLTAAEGNPQENLIRLAIATGCRQGELFALHWADVDLQNERLTVRYTMQRRRGRQALAKPKTQAGIRTMALPQMAVQALQDQRKLQMASGMAGSELVFPNNAGNLQNAANFNRAAWQPVRQRAGLPESVTFHTLRHSCATLMLMAGVNPRVAQQRLGHANVALTLQTYSHVLAESDSDAASRIDAAFGQTDPEKYTTGTKPPEPGIAAG